MAEVTGAQIDALNDAINGLATKISGGGGTGGTGGGGGGGADPGVFKGAKDLAAGMATGTAQIRDFGKALPMGLLGKFGTALQNGGLAVIDYVVGTKKEFEGLSKVGAGLGGDLGLLQVTAAETRMSLPEFSKMIKSNSTLLTQFGGGMSDGIDKFAKLSDAMFKGDNAPINTFMRLGMTIEESNEFMLQTLAVNQRSARFRNMSEAAQLKQAQEYAKNLDLVSKLTGKNAKELQKEADSRMQEGDINATLRLRERQGAEGATQAFQAIQGNLSQGGGGGGGGAAPKLNGQTMNLGGPIDSQTAMFASLNPKTAAMAKELDRISKDTTISADQRRKLMDAKSKELIAAAAQESQSTQNLQIARTAAVTEAGAIAAGSLQEMDKIINAIGAQADKIGVSLTETGGHFTAFNSLMAKLQTEQDKQVADSGQATAAMRAVTETQQAIANTSSAVRVAMGKQLQSNETIGKAFSDVADSLEKAKLPERFDNLADALSRFATVENLKTESTTGDEKKRFRGGKMLARKIKDP